MQIKRLTSNKVDKLSTLDVFEETFEMQNFVKPAVNHLQKLLLNDNFIVYTAAISNQIIAGLTAHVLPSYYLETAEVYIYDLAVQPKYQRQGIGRTLINELKDYCKQQGFKLIFVQADAGDKQAIDFYRATGGIPEDVVHFNYPLGSAIL